MKWDDDAGIVINLQHVRSQIITRAFPYLDGDALKIDAALPNTTAGRDAATNVREGILTGLSRSNLRSAGLVAADGRRLSGKSAARTLAAAGFGGPRKFLQRFYRGNQGKWFARQQGRLPMAINITSAEVATAIRAGSAATVRAEVGRLLAVARIIIDRDMPTAPTIIANAAATMWVSYAYDRPNASGYNRYANIMRNSGAGQLLLPYRVIRAGNVALADTPTAATPSTTTTPETPIEPTPSGNPSPGAGVITFDVARVYVGWAEPGRRAGNHHRPKQRAHFHEYRRTDTGVWRRGSRR